MVLDLKRNFVVFDLEFTELLSTETDYTNVQISCASTLISTESIPNVWYDTDSVGNIQNHLSTQTVNKLFEYLLSFQNNGYAIVTWGGTASDFKVLSKKVDIHYVPYVIQMCLDHYDIPFSSGTYTGMMMGLSAAAKGMGLQDKEFLSSGIPDLWKTDKNSVLRHVSNDSYMTCELAKHILVKGSMPWITSKGHYKMWNPAILNTVRNCLQLPVPKVKFEIQNTMNPKWLSKWIFELE